LPVNYLLTALQQPYSNGMAISGFAKGS
jgi:hypothetical protein